MKSCIVASRIPSFVSWVILCFAAIVLIPGHVAAAKSSAGFDHIDSHALKASRKVEKSIASLSAYLTKPARDDREKVRAIFRWIAENIAYDIDAYRAGRACDVSPEGVLRNRKSVCSGYAALFQSLAEKAGLKAVTIKGYSKGYGYAAGAKMRSTNHAWNAVMLEGKWQLLDATWGAGYIDERGRFVRRFNEHFFLTPPEKFIFDHYPEHERWQLLAKTVSMQQYQDFVFLRSTAFLNGIGAKSHNKNTIQARKELTVVLTAPEDTLLLANLMLGSHKLPEDYTFVQRDGQDCFIHAQLPQKGDYILRVFAKKNGDPGSYGWAMDYRIISKASGGADRTYPATFTDFMSRKAYLVEPMAGRLKAGKKHQFRLRAPGADKVMVKTGSGWHDLKARKGVFTGAVLIEKGEVIVMARYPGNNGFSGLLSYSGY